MPPAFPNANPPDILRAVEQDRFYIQKLNEIVMQILKKYSGPRTFIKYQKHIYIWSKFLYLLVTVGLGEQTIGQELTDICLIDGTKKPTLIKRLALIISTTFSPLVFQQLVKYSCKLLNEHRHHRLVHVLTRLNELVTQWGSELDVALFYLFKKYLTAFHRIFGLEFIFVRQVRQNEGRVGFEILGLMIITRFLIKTFGEQNIESLDFNDEYVKENQYQCLLCLENQKVSTATPCGHVFCWKCIADWCREKRECPICRQKISPSHLFPLANY